MGGLSGVRSDEAMSPRLQHICVLRWPSAWGRKGEAESLGFVAELGVVQSGAVAALC